MTEKRWAEHCALAATALMMVSNVSCQDVLRLSGTYIADSSSDRVETVSDFPQLTVKFDMGSEIVFEADGNRQNYRAIVGQRVLMETYAIGGGVPCIVDSGFARFRKETFKRSRFRFSFQCHYDGQNGTSGYSFEGHPD